MNWTRIASIARQIGAVLAIIAGIVTSPDVTSKLPASVDVVLIAVGGAILAIEHAFNGNPKDTTTKPLG